MGNGHKQEGKARDLTTGEVPRHNSNPVRCLHRGTDTGGEGEAKGPTRVIRHNLAPAQHETSKPGSLACSPSFDSPPDAYKDKGCLTGVDVRSGTGDKPGGHTLQRNGHRRGGDRRELTGRRRNRDALQGAGPSLGVNPFQGALPFTKKRELSPGLSPASPGSVALPHWTPSGARLRRSGFGDLNPTPFRWAGGRRDQPGGDGGHRPSLSERRSPIS
ncbi:UNVERIFIED_CONTAM: hypothetical protein FKN15_029999 [Acipenser sinensis]